jgi:hypothetical protein
MLPFFLPFWGQVTVCIIYPFFSLVNVSISAKLIIFSCKREKITEIAEKSYVFS